MEMRRILVGLAAASVACGTLAACGNGGSGSGASSSGSGSVLKLYQLAPLQSQVVSAPYMKTSADAAVSAINAAGGVNGHKIAVETCDDQFDAQVSLRCAQKAITDPDTVAVIGSLTGAGPQIMPLFEKAKIPVIGSDVLAPIDGTSPMAFPIDTGVPGPDIAATAVAKKYLHVAKIGVIQQDQPQSAANIPYFDAGTKQSGVPVAKYINVPSDASDMSSYVSQAKDAGTSVLMTTVQAPQVLAIWKAIGSTNAGITLMGSGSQITQSLVDQAGSLAENTYVMNGVPNPDDSNPTGQQYLKEMAKYQPSEKVLNGLGLRAWADVHLVAEVAKTMKGDITRKTFLPALQKVHGMHFMWLDSLSFDKPGPISTLPRIVATTIFPSVVKNGKLTPLDKFDPYA